MRRVVVVLSICVVAFWGCGPRKGVPCGGSPCSESEICDQTLKLCVANVSPRIVIDAPAQNALVGTTTFELRGTINDDNGKVKSAEYAVVEGDWKQLAVDERGAFATTVQTPVLDGVLTAIKVRATDAVDVTGEATTTVKFDVVAPRCEIVSPTADGPIRTGNTLTGTIEATLVDGTAVTAEVSLDNGATFKPLTVAGETGTYPFALSPNVERAPLTLHLRGQDEGGNSCTRGPVAAFVDTQAPVIYIAQPDDGDILSSATAPFAVDMDGGAGGRPTFFYRIDGGVFTPFTDPVLSNAYGSRYPVDDVDYTPLTIDLLARDPAGNETMEARTVIFDRKAPVITFTSPANDTLFSKANAVDAGNQFTTSWLVTDGDPLVTFERAVGRDSDGGFSPTTTASYTYATNPADNGNAYITSVRAKDRGGNVSTATHRFRVDVVNPSFTVSPAAGARMTERALRLSFSEQTTFTNRTTALSWDASGPMVGDFAQFTDGGYGWMNLTEGTLYRGTLAPQGNDVAGNPIVQVSNFNFFTDPVAPDSGTVLATDAGILVAAFDQDGVVSFADALYNANGSLRVRRFSIDPVTGAVTKKDEQLLTGATPTNFKIDLSTWAQIGSDGSAYRKVGLNTFVGAVANGYVTAPDGSPINSAGVSAFILPSAIGTEVPRTGPVDYGVIFSSGGTQTYSRPPNADVIHPSPGNITVGGQLAYVVWRITANTFGNPPMTLYAFDRAIYACRAPPFFGDVVCSLEAFSGVGANGRNPTIVLTPAGIADYVLENATGVRTEVCRDEYIAPGYGPCVGTCSATRAAEPDLTVHPAHLGSTIFGVRTTGANFEIVERSLDSRCTKPWNVVLTLPTAGADRPIPVRFGNTRAALYRDSSGNIRVVR